MSGVRSIEQVPADRVLRIAVPQWLGEHVEIIIKKAAGDETPAPEDAGCAQMQREGGFLKGVLDAAHEDVWNDL